MTNDPRRVQVCRADELPPGEVRKLDLDPPIAVYNVDGEFYATADTCSHGQSSLAADGYVDGAEIECGWHSGVFCIRTGAALMAPAVEPLDTYVAEVADGMVVVLVPSTVVTIRATGTPCGVSS